MGIPAVPLDSFTTFGSLLKYLRSRAQLTQLELSTAVGYSEAQISRLEHSQRPPGPARLAALFVPALGLENEPEIVSRLLELAAQARDQPVDAEPKVMHPGPAPLSWQVAARSNLPAELTSFIGREHEVSAVCQRVLDHRLVTLTGAGGVGKTRLALRAARELLAYFPDGIWWVDLAPLTDSTLVLQTVAACFGLSQQPGQDLLGALEGLLKAGSLLLVLDNCEHLIGEAARLVSHLLLTCPELHILATSRGILRVKGEEMIRCPSLSLPAERQISGPQQVDLGELARSEAVLLFIERARSIDPELTLTETNFGPVAQICRRLDGIPLAIELAAARVRMLSVEQIAARLDRAFLLLTGGDRAARPRHQTLRASIDWSYELLPPLERSLLCRLAVFAGSWTLEAAEQVCAGVAGNKPDQIQTHQVVDLLGSLIDQSLVQFKPEAGPPPRYRMLETVRQYALGCLIERGEESALRERHLDYFLGLAQHAESHLRAKQARSWLDRLDCELDNLRLALDWSLSRRDWHLSRKMEKGLQLAACLHWFWWERNHIIEGAEWLEKLIQEQSNRTENRSMIEEPSGYGRKDRDHLVALGRALNVLGLIILYNSEKFPRRTEQMKPKRKEFGRKSQAIFQALCDESGDKFDEAYSKDLLLSRFIQSETVDEVLACRDQLRGKNELFWVAECDAFLTDYVLYYDPQKIDDWVVECAEESLLLHKQIGDEYGMGEAYFTLSNFALIWENEERAIELAKEGISSMEAFGDQDKAAVLRTRYIMYLTEVGDDQEAVRQLGRLRHVAFEYNSRFFYLEHQMLWAFLAWNKGENGLAARYAEEVLESRESLPADIALRAIYISARICLSQGNVTRARAYLREYFEQANNPWFIFKGIQVLGILAARERQMQLSVKLFGAQDFLWEQGGRQWFKLSPRERSENEPALAAAREALGEETFAVAWESGRAMTLDQITLSAREFINKSNPPTS